MLSGQKWCILALIFIWRSFCHWSIYHTGHTWQWDSSLVSTLLSAVINSHAHRHTQPNTVNKTFPATLTLPFSTCQPSPKETAIWFTYTRTAIPGVSTEKDLISALLFPGCLFDIPKYVIRTQPGGFQSMQRGYYTGFVNFSFTALSTSIRPLSFSVSLSVSVSLHLPLTFSLLPLPLCILFLCLLAHKLSVLPAIPIIVPCSGAENRGVKSEMCGARLFSSLQRLFSCVTHLPVLRVRFWSITGVFAMLISFSH